jgi:hypothetical protein
VPHCDPVARPVSCTVTVCTSESESLPGP